jgi:hypothetical protein
MGVEMLAVLELIDGATVGAPGFAGFADIQKNLGMGAPGFHFCQGAGAAYATLMVQVFCQKFYVLHV